ncbi:MAG: T9SS type A sorting domain-containing protein [Bacteroidales bacterium]
MKIQKSTHGISHALFLIFVGMVILSGVQPFQVSAQEVNIVGGTCLVNSGNLLVEHNTSIVNTGTFINDTTGSVQLTGNWQNNGTYIGAAGSNVTLDGDSAQTIGGSSETSFSNLTLNNSGNIILSNNIGINGILDFQFGLLNTGTYVATIGPAGTITGAGESRFVNGNLAMIFETPALKQFPIGNDRDYGPLSLQFDSLTGTSVVTAGLFETPLTGTLPSGITLLTTKRSWTVTQTGGSNFQYFLTLDPSGLDPVHSVVMLKQDADTIASFGTTKPHFTNTKPLTSFSEFGLGEGTGYDMCGGILYHNPASTPIDSTWVTVKQNNIPVDSMLTRQAGTYAFSNNPNGTYTISERTSKAWLSVNATDALKVQRHSAGFEILTEPVRLQAADVDNNKQINEKDATRIKRRFVSLDNYFDLGDWTFAKPTGGDTLIIHDAHVNQDIWGLCVGDVNGSNIPGAGGAGAGFLVLEQKEIIRAVPGEVIEIPVKVSSAASIGAISMVLSYPNNLMQVNEMKTEHGTPYDTTKGNHVRMAWSETTPLSLGKDQTMLILVVKISDQFSKEDQINLSLDPESEIANAGGEVFDTLILNAPTILYKYGEGVEDKVPAVKFEVYPVPNNGEFTAEITSADQKTFSIRIYNQLGQVIHEVKEIRVKGKRVLRFEQGNLPDGIYTLVLQNDAGSATRKIIITH